MFTVCTGAGGEGGLEGDSTVATTVTATGSALCYCSTLSENIFIETDGSSSYSLLFRQLFGRLYRGGWVGDLALKTWSFKFHFGN